MPEEPKVTEDVVGEQLAPFIRVQRGPVPRREQPFALVHLGVRAVAVRRDAARGVRPFRRAAEELRDLPPPLLQHCLVVLQPQEFRNPCRCLCIHTAAVEWPCAVRVHSVHVGSTVQQQLYDLRSAHERSRVQRRTAVAVARVDIRAAVEQPFHRFDASVQRRPRQRRHAEDRVIGVERCARVDMVPQRGGVA